MISRDFINTHLKAKFTWDDYIKLIADYKAWLTDRNLSSRIMSDYIPIYDGELIDFVFRFNPDESYNDVLRFNDLKVLVQRLYEDEEWACQDYFFYVTADPKTKQRGIAHFLPQVYRGNRGNHRAIFGRTCIRSDYGCWYFRTGDEEPEFGCIGLNQHNSAGLFNTSLGCIINENETRWRTVEKPLLESITNPKHIPCCIVSQEFTEEYFKNV